MRGKPLLPGQQQLSSKFLLDSMILMDYERSHEECISWWENYVLNGCKMYISAISLMELYKKVANSHGPRSRVLQELDERVESMMRDKKIYRILPVNKRIAKKAYELFRDYCLHYTPPQERCRMEALICDMFIAATALLNGLSLYTFNQKDFEWITGLQVMKPSYEPSQERRRS